MYYLPFHLYFFCTVSAFSHHLSLKRNFILIYKYYLIKQHVIRKRNSCVLLHIRYAWCVREKCEMRLAFWAHLYKVPWNMPPNFDLVRIYCIRKILIYIFSLLCNYNLLFRFIYIYNGDNNEVFLKVKRPIYSWTNGASFDSKYNTKYH